MTFFRFRRNAFFIYAGCLISLILYGITAQGQELSKERKVLKDLCAPDMHGRGYVQKGDSIAAAYIAAAFADIGLETYNDSWYQYFSFPVNTFPGKVALLIDSHEPEPGKDFIIDPCSPGASLSNSQPLLLSPGIFADSAELARQLSTAKNRLILFPEDPAHKKVTGQWTDLWKKENPHQLAGIIMTGAEKLTFHTSTSVCKIPFITLLKDSARDYREVKEVSFRIDQQHIPDYDSRNVIGKITGKTHPDSIILVCGHYDHLGRMGTSTYFPGANDNASGIAMLISLAQYYSQPENQPDHTLVFIAFAAEELGLIGSRYFADQPVFPLSNLKFVLNLDLVGTGEDGIKVVNGKVFRDHFDNLQRLNKKHDLVPGVHIRGPACNSDHCPFYEKGIPSFFIYTLGGIKAYHDIYDRAETLPLTEFQDLKQLLVLFIGSLQEPGERGFQKK